MTRSKVALIFNLSKTSTNINGHKTHAVLSESHRAVCPVLELLAAKKCAFTKSKPLRNTLKRLVIKSDEKIKLINPIQLRQVVKAIKNDCNAAWHGEMNVQIDVIEATLC